MRWNYSDGLRTGYIYPENLPHHGPTGMYGAKVWRTGQPEPGPNEHTRGGFSTRDEAMRWVETWID